MILLTGATGVVGSALLTRLLQEGEEVRCLVRDPRRLGPNRVRVQITLGDLANPVALRMDHSPPAWLHPQLFLTCVAAAWQRAHGGPAPPLPPVQAPAAPPPPMPPPPPPPPPPPMLG